MSWHSRLWSFLNSGIGLLLFGFGITTIVGGLFADSVQRRTWERQIALEQARQDYEWERSMRFELLRAKLKEGQESLEEISDLINLRFFRMQRVFDALGSGNHAYPISTGSSGSAGFFGPPDTLQIAGAGRLIKEELLKLQQSTEVYPTCQNHTPKANLC
ncbi:MAG: hypothetical protein KKC76_17715 [Proteobacteria bacterium]|nr:hypothetical protein [Pseudomonadota bacterium]MBU4296151.1 hypothetical protein [Pseudomonadota bacterium]MCG2746779.1 hypothetical protein [Desulfobulbaceae bacterium]